MAAERILVVDDEELNRDLLQQMLEREGYQVAIAANGQEALALLRQETFHVVLTDLKILRVLQEREFERIGGTRTIKVDVRILAATNKNLEDLVARQQFRDDLFWRLNVIPITIPPLRERLSDIPLLMAHFITRFNAEKKQHLTGITPEALQMLKNYHWPGNVRELENTM